MNEEVYRFFRSRGITTGLFFRIRDYLCPIDFIIRQIPAQGTLLDIGCGIGVFTTSFAVSHPELQILGCDINLRRIAKARQVASNIRNLKFIDGDVQTLFNDTQFDCITMIDVIHHLPSPLQIPLIHWAYTHLKPGGRLIIKDIDSNPPWTLAAAKLHDYLRSPWHPTAFLSPEILLEKMGKLGATASDIKRYRRIYLSHILYIFKKMA